MKMGEKLEKAVDIVGEILAFFTVAIIVFLSVNRFVADGAGFLPANATKILESIREIAVLVVVGLAGLEFALKRGFVVFLFYAALVAAAVIFLFFPHVLPATQSLLRI